MRCLASRAGNPYMEDPGTLWLLHWQLLAPPSLLPVWWIAFNEFHPVEFTDEVLDHAVAVGLESVGRVGEAASSFIRKEGRQRSIADLCTSRTLETLGEQH